ncbi:energy transducer TonB [Pedobacter immunditicola]|uniref:energy transducer TonB n=1 Tax=Pedobacter immunditicola TaxID=3133440 RepID=UPI003097FEDA
MFSSKIDLFREEWLDLIFDQKNKSYGAYALRKQNSSNTTKSLLYAGTVFIFLFLTPKIISLINGPSSADEIMDGTTVTQIAPPPPVNPDTPPPPPVEPPPPKQAQVKFPPPIVRADHLVSAEEPPQIIDLKEANPGQKTIAGDPEAEIVIAGPSGNGPKQAAIVEDTEVYNMIHIENQPSFPGGMDKFYAYLQKSVKYPPMAAERNTQGKVFLSFVVEKNGELTDIKVDRALGDGTDEEAIRVLKASPRWTPGIQNGRPVRVKYNIPISFTLAQ